MTRCRHCPKNIHRLDRPDQVWVDDDGFAVCQKYTGPLPARFMVHEPMPQDKGN